MTLGVIKRSEDELANWLGTEAWFIGALCRYDDEPIELEPYQLAFLSNRSRFRWITKSRQVGYSFVAALEALARCHLRDGYTSVFVSFNPSSPSRPRGRWRSCFLSRNSQLTSKVIATARKPTLILSESVTCSTPSVCDASITSGSSFLHP